MILILYSKLRKNDGHAVKELQEQARQRKIKTILLDMHSFGERSHTLELRKGKIQLNHVPVERFSGVVCLNVPRCDAMIRFESGVRYPNRLRHQSAAFVEDLGYILSGMRWVPGSLAAIAQGNAKMNLFREAKTVGLRVPDVTSYSKIAPPEMRADGWYRKPLGFPCVLSHDNFSHQERLVESVCQFRKVRTSSLYYHQWQTPVLAAAQTRSQVVGHRFWSAVWDKGENPTLDLRKASRERRVTWQKYSLPEPEQEKILRLMGRLKLCAASPEFIVGADGDLTFCDLNPGGDFRGPFEPSEVREIAGALLTEALA